MAVRSLALKKSFTLKVNFVLNLKDSCVLQSFITVNANFSCKNILSGYFLGSSNNSYPNFYSLSHIFL